jgi:hypothetical protein
MTVYDFNSKYHMVTHPNCRCVTDYPVNGTEDEVIRELLKWADEQLQLMDILVLKTFELN